MAIQPLGVAETPTPGTRPDAQYNLSETECRFFHTFGYLLKRNLLSDDLEAICGAFDEVMSHPDSGGDNLQYADGDRLSVPAVLDLHTTLADLRTDPRIMGVIHSLIGDEWEYSQSDGNLMDCETAWHRDVYGSPLDIFHIKILFYLEPLTADTGALRVMPGTHYYDESYIEGILPGCGFPDRMEEFFGHQGSEMPSIPLETNPGDAIILNFRTLHASYKGSPGRRLFTVNYRDISGWERRLNDSA